jgi:hypothetical protein
MGNQVVTCDPANKLPLEVFETVAKLLAQNPICPRRKVTHFYRYILVSSAWSRFLMSTFLGLPLVFCVAVVDNAKKKCRWCSPDPDTEFKNQGDIYHCYLQRKLIRRLRDPMTEHHLKYVTQIYFECDSAGEAAIRKECDVLQELMNKMPKLKSIQFGGLDKYDRFYHDGFADCLRQLSAPASFSRITSLNIPIGILDDIPLSLSFPNVRDLTLSGKPIEVNRDHPDLDKLTTWVATMRTVECLRFYHRLRLKEYPLSITKIYFNCRIRPRPMEDVIKFYTAIVALPKLEVLSLCPAPITGTPPQFSSQDIKVVLPSIACRNLKTLVFAADEIVETIGRLMIIALLEQCTSLDSFSYFGVPPDKPFVLPNSVTHFWHGPPPEGRWRPSYRSFRDHLGQQHFEHRTTVRRPIYKLCALLDEATMLRTVHLDADDIIQHMKGENVLASLASACPKVNLAQFSSREHINDSFYVCLDSDFPTECLIKRTDRECEIDVRLYRLCRGMSV